METPLAVRLTRAPIDLAALHRDLGRPSIGALASFAGVVRAETGPAGQPLDALEYSAYEPMALREMQALVEQARGRFEISAVALIHRLGALCVGETSVAAVVAAPHRAAALAACAWLIDGFKERVPIFKRERWRGGAATWVEGI